MKTSQNGIELIKKFEGCVLRAYKCPAGVWTIGYGTTANVKEGDVITKEEAEKRLKDHLAGIEPAINAMIKVNVTQNQFDALMSFAYNVGEYALKKSTLLGRLNSGDPNGASTEFMKWVYVNGKIFDGLVKRRKKEQALFLKV